MNKPPSNRSFSSTKPNGMRVVYKHRNNPKHTYQPPLNRSTPRFAFNESRSLTDFEEESDNLTKISQIKDYVKNRMRTEYTDNFKGAQDSLRREKDACMRESGKLRESATKKEGGRERDRSFVSTSRSGFLQPTAQTAQADRSEEKKQEYCTLEEIEDRIETLMDNRLKDCLNFKKKEEWAIESELSKLISSLKEIKSSDNPEATEADLSQLSKKIRLLEQLLAENMAESDIIKKHYLSKLTNPPHRRYKTLDTKRTDAPSYMHRTDYARNESLVRSSTNQAAFQKPNRSAYKIHKHCGGFYDADKHRQPLPRSSYNREYLVYGVAPSAPFKPAESSDLRGYSSSKLLDSSYRSDFVRKKAEKINIRELDACRDKFKNLPVIFGRKEKEDLATKFTNYLQEKKAKPKHKVEKYEAVPYLSKYLLSESRREFGVEQGSASAIKHANLQKLKYQYKKKLHV